MLKAIETNKQISVLRFSEGNYRVSYLDQHIFITTCPYYYDWTSSVSSNRTETIDGVEYKVNVKKRGLILFDYHYQTLGVMWIEVEKKIKDLNSIDSPEGSFSYQGTAKEILAEIRAHIEELESLNLQIQRICYEKGIKL